MQSTADEMVQQLTQAGYPSNDIRIIAQVLACLLAGTYDAVLATAPEVVGAMMVKRKPQAEELRITLTDRGLDITEQVSVASEIQQKFV